MAYTARRRDEILFSTAVVHMLTLQHETEVAGGAGVVQVALPNDFDALVNEAKEKLQLTKVFKLFQQDGTKRSARDAITNLL